MNQYTTRLTESDKEILTSRIEPKPTQSGSLYGDELSKGGFWLWCRSDGVDAWRSIKEVDANFLNRLLAVMTAEELRKMEEYLVCVYIKDETIKIAYQEWLIKRDLSAFVAAAVVAVKGDGA